MPTQTALEKARATAKAAGLFFTPDPAGYALFRRMPTSRPLIGRAKTPEALRRLISRCAKTI